MSVGKLSRSFEVLSPSEPSRCRIQITVDGKILSYKEIRTWSEEKYQDLKENQPGFESSQREQFNETYEVSADNFEVEFSEENHSTVFRCDIQGKISENGGEYTATFLWFLNPQELDFIDDDFEESNTSLSWSGKINETQTVITIDLPTQDSVYEDWGGPVGHCHGHVWWTEPRVQGENYATVTKVVDGDTVDVEFPDGGENRIRMLGVDTPESYGEVEPDEWVGIDNKEHLQKWGEKAKEYTKTRLLHQEIRLKFDDVAGRVGYYGRLLAYIIIDNANYNLELVEEGYARAYTEANCELLENLVEAEEKAREDRIGVWSILENQPKTEGVYISNVHPDAEPTPEREHLDDEYIVITNGGSSSTDMSNWVLHDNGRKHEFVFPGGFSLPAGGKVTVYTGLGENAENELWWGSESPV